MFYIINDFLTSDDLRKLNLIYDTEATFLSGKYGNEENPMVKNNLVMQHDEAYYKCGDIVKNQMMLNSELTQFTSLKRTSNFTFTQYNKGHFYEPHIDAYYMENYVRTDMSCTIFLNEPEEYDGGELSVNLGSSVEVNHKLKAGTLLLYPTNEYHSVKQITRGKRRVCIFWIESHICDPVVREAIGQLSRVFFENNEGLNNADDIKKVIQKPIFALKKVFSTLS
jgi:PKHD-type hydroxylase